MSDIGIGKRRATRCNCDDDDDEMEQLHRAIEELRALNDELEASLAILKATTIIVKQ